MHNDINSKNDNKDNNDSVEQGANAERGEVLYGIDRTAGEHSAAIRAFAVLVTGVAIGLIFNAVCGYEYSAALVERAAGCFYPPFEGAGGFFDVLMRVADASAVDAVLFLLVAMFGVSYICHQGCMLILMARGVGLGVSVGVLATLAAAGMLRTKHGGTCAVVYLLFSSVISVLLVFFSSFAERASCVFRSLSERDTGIIFTARFGAYLVVCIAAEGAVLMIRAVYLLLIHILTL